MDSSIRAEAVQSVLTDAVRSLASHVFTSRTGRQTPTAGGAPSAPATNEDILNYQEGYYPKTLHDLGSTSWWFDIDAEKSDDHKDFFSYIRNYGFCTEVRHGNSFHKMLPQIDDASFSDVFMICRTGSTVVEAFRHWSVYTQGHLFHLKAEKRKPENAIIQTGITGQSTSGTEYLRNLLMPDRSRCTNIRLKYEDLFGQTETTAGASSSGEQRKRPKHATWKFIAYHVGQTRYSGCEILMLAAYVIKHMKAVGTYNALENNCQHFVQSLIRRIVMTQRKGIAVCGHLEDIAQWSVGNPAYALKPWLTKTKARFMLLPLTKSSQSPPRMKGYRKLHSRPYHFRSWHEWVQTLVFEASWERLPKQSERAIIHWKRQKNT